MPASVTTRKTRSSQAAAPAHEVSFSNIEKVFFPEAGFTKGEMIRYYLDVAPYILPHLRNRPVTLIRFPNGAAGEKFYEKNAPRFTPGWVRTFKVPRQRHEGSINYIVIDDASTLAWCANLAAIELHPFLHRVDNLDRPDYIAFDLDPGESADLLTCVRVAFLMKELLDSLRLTAFPKVSGSKGIQLYVPLHTPVTYDETAAFAHAMAGLLEQQQPDLVVSRMQKVLRRGRVLIDWSQNSRSKTTVSVYSMRAKRAEPFVSMPVTWDELKSAQRRKKPAALFFSPAAALKRLQKLGDLHAPLLTLKQKLPREFMAAKVARGAEQEAAAAAPNGSLAEYSAKRDFRHTAEPPPRRPARRRGHTTVSPTETSGRFVIQKHAASRLHYDFRLEMGGTLKSWAIPKGVPTELGVKRSAFAVEDHPIDYLKFEGTIPAGQYGGGTVMVWDIGEYELLGGSYESGNLKLRLAGKKLIGEWHMFKIRSEDGKDVWLIAKSGVAAKPISARRDDMSVLTRRTMAGIASDQRSAVWQSHRS